MSHTSRRLKPLFKLLILSCALCFEVRTGDSDVEKELHERFLHSDAVTNLEISSASAFRVVDLLRRSFRLPICFESPGLDLETQGVSAQEKYNELICKKALTREESDFLKSVSKLVKVTPKINVDWRETKYALQYSNETSLHIISDIFHRLSAEFDIREDNHFIVIAPKQGSFLTSELGQISISASTLGEALTQLGPIFEKEGIGVYPDIGMGKVFDSKILPLNLADVTLSDLLVKLAQSAKPSVYWNIGGLKGSRNISFHYLGESNQR